MRADSLFFLIDEQKRSYYVENENVFFTGSPRPLQYAPDGWQDIRVENQRNTKYFALDRSMTVPLKFVEDGAQILKNQYYKYGVEADLSLLVLKLKLFYDGIEYGYYYDLLYMGEIDFSQFKDESTWVTVNVIEGGIPKYVKARENTKFEIPVDVPEKILIKWDGIFLREKQKHTIFPGITGVDHIIGTSFITKEGNAFGLAPFSTYTSPASGINYQEDPRFFLAGGMDIQDVAITGKIRFNYLGSGGGGTIYLKSNFGQSIVLGTFPTGAGIKQINVNTTFDSANGERWFLFSDLVGLSTANYEETDLFLEFRSRKATEYIEALRPAYVLEQLTQKATDAKFSSQSNVLTEFENVVMVSGAAIRKLPDAKIVTSLNDFFQSYDSDFCLGMGAKNNKLTIEKKVDWIDYADPEDLGEVADLVVSPALDYIFNTGKFGSPEQTYDDVNARNEPNNTISMLFPITRIAKEMNKVSVYQKDSYGAEYLRINLDAKDSTDNQSDNKIWMVHVKKDPIEEVIDGVPTLVYEFDRTLNASATGIDEPETIFNLFLSPKHSFLRNGAFVRSCFYKQDNQWIKFLTTEKNHTLSVTDNGQLIDEDADEEIASLDDPMFTPNLLEFKTQVPMDLLEILEANPLKSFQFTYYGIPFVGIPVRIAIEPTSEDSQTYTLLSAPSNDLTQLETIFDS